MIVERTCYLPKPGKVAEVLATRRRASAVRVAEACRPGTIYEGDIDGVPWVYWEARFNTVAEHDADLATRDRSEAFAAVRAEMRALIAHFDRVVMRPVSGPGRARCWSTRIFPASPSCRWSTSSARAGSTSRATSSCRPARGLSR